METEKKYKLTDEYRTIRCIKLYRIEALKDFGAVHKGDKGGFIGSEKNLSQKGDCWVYGDAEVYDNAMVWGNADIYGDAMVWGNAVVCGNAKVCGNADIYGNAKVSGNVHVFGNAVVYDNARVFGDAEVYGNASVIGNARVVNNADYIVFKNWWSSGRYFTWTRSNNMWRVGCFYGTGEELIAKAYRDSNLSGREYERVVKYVESILKED